MMMQQQGHNRQGDEGKSKILNEEEENEKEKKKIEECV